MTDTNWNCLVIDAGARYGLHPSWRDTRDICEFHLFEPEPIEANRLKIRFQNSANISVHAIALAAKNEMRRLTVRSHRGLSNLDDWDFDLSEVHPDFKSSAMETNKIDVQAVSIDEFFNDTRVDFLKLDAEGSDYEILSGARNKLRASILGIRINFYFKKYSENSKTFSDFDFLLRDLNFNLQRIEYSERINKIQGLFPLSTDSGSLLGGDAVWTRNPSDVYTKNSNELNVMYALFLYSNSLEDVALQFLVDTSQHYDLGLSEAKSNPFINLLETKILSHLASALAAGWWDSKKITDTYSNLFNKDFPTKEELYLRLYP